MNATRRNKATGLQFTDKRVFNHLVQKNPETSRCGSFHYILSNVQKL